MALLCTFTDRHHGVSKTPYISNNLAYHVNDDPSHVKENRRLTCKALGIETDQLVWMEQVHGTRVRLVRGKCAQAMPSCDGIITDRTNLALMVMVADCVPILIHDPVKKAIGAVHAGRKGVFSYILKATVEAMREHFGSEPKDLHVTMGPHIHNCCYELSGNVLEEAKTQYGAFVTKNRLDMQGILKAQCKALGLLHVNESKVCTCCEKDYFSYRRDGVTGRSAGIIMMKETHG